MKYDLIILGGGPAGYHAASLAVKGGLSTLLIEESNVGGVCLNAGCVPSKSFLHVSNLIKQINSMGDVIDVGNVKINHKEVVREKSQLVNNIRNALKRQLINANVNIFSGKGLIKGRYEGLFQVEAEGEIYTTERILISTGSEAIIPDISGIREALHAGIAVTNQEVFDIDEIGDSLIFIGGGNISLELASYYSALGIRVSILERKPKLLEEFDSDITDLLVNRIRREGIEVELNCEITDIKGNSIVYCSEGEEKKISADRIVVCAGRKARISDIGLESIEVDINNGRIVVDENGQTNISGIYAAGDVTSSPMLAHVAYREAEICIGHILGEYEENNIKTGPYVVYTNPELAGVGYTEKELREQEIDYKVAKIPMTYSAKYSIESGKEMGVLKMMYSPDDMKILGVSMLGNGTSEIIYGMGIALNLNMTVRDLKKIIFPHPSISEIIHELVFSII